MQTMRDSRDEAELVATIGGTVQHSWSYVPGGAAIRTFDPGAITADHVET